MCVHRRSNRVRKNVSHYKKSFRSRLEPAPLKGQLVHHVLLSGAPRCGRWKARSGGQWAEVLPCIVSTYCSECKDVQMDREARAGGAAAWGSATGADSDAAGTSAMRQDDARQSHRRIGPVPLL